MKTFLNVIGALALLGGLLAFLAATSAIHQILGGIGVLTGCTALGFALLAERLDTHLERTSAQRLLERKHWEDLLGAVRAPTGMPRLPKAQIYHVDTEHGVSGPHSFAELQALLDRGMIAADSMVWREGTTDWVRFRTYLP